ncbi:MAG: ParA family protein [Neomegalonema sp.]|nr:ParA family protein [Neomegalonema sp.]
MGNVVSFINMKGGVGKTTSSVTLCETFADYYGARVLLIDLDAQASASCAILGDDVFEKTVEDELTLATYFDHVADGDAAPDLADWIIPSRAHHDSGMAVDVICAEPSLRFTERHLIERYYKLRLKRVVTPSAPEGQARRIMRDQLGRLRQTYDLIVIDCPPGISIFAEAGVSCSDLIVMPTIPDYLSTLGLLELNKRFLRQLRRDGNLAGRTAILRTKVQLRSEAHIAYQTRLEGLVKEGVLESIILDSTISENPIIARALDVQHLGETYKMKYKSAGRELRDFADEIRELLANEKTSHERRSDLSNNAA